MRGGGKLFAMHILHISHSWSLFYCEAVFHWLPQHAKTLKCPSGFHQLLQLLALFVACQSCVSSGPVLLCSASVIAGNCTNGMVIFANSNTNAESGTVKGWQEAGLVRSVGFEKLKPGSKLVVWSSKADWPVKWTRTVSSNRYRNGNIILLVG